MYYFKHNIGVIHNKKYNSYPKDKPYHPDVDFPEYPFKGFLSKKNGAYSSVRDCLKILHLDPENIDSERWNPFKKYINPGDNVVIKPNLVFHSRAPQDRKRVECTITHGSVIRAVVDYVVIALKGKGSITIADTPLEPADFESIKEYTGIEEICMFIRENAAININYVDCRIRQTIRGISEKRAFSWPLPG